MQSRYRWYNDIVWYSKTRWNHQKRSNKYLLKAFVPSFTISVKTLRNGHCQAIYGYTDDNQCASFMKRNSRSGHGQVGVLHLQCFEKVGWIGEDTTKYKNIQTLYPAMIYKHLHLLKSQMLGCRAALQEALGLLKSCSSCTQKTPGLLDLKTDTLPVSKPSKPIHNQHSHKMMKTYEKQTKQLLRRRIQSKGSASDPQRHWNKRCMRFHDMRMKPLALWAAEQQHLFCSSNGASRDFVLLQAWPWKQFFGRVWLQDNR